MLEYVVLLLVIFLLFLALDAADARWGGDSRHEIGDRNW